ncbi:MAG: hypothetical protein ACLQHS_06735, partial [Candidatus Limnocylindrales bacterium]
LDVPRGQAELAKSVGSHLVEDLSNLGFRAGEPTGIDRAAFDAVCARLEGAGYRLAPRDQAWEAFSATRSSELLLREHGLLLRNSLTYAVAASEDLDKRGPLIEIGS